jgi:hypothetical protein
MKQTCVAAVRIIIIVIIVVIMLHMAALLHRKQPVLCIAPRTPAPVPCLCAVVCRGGFLAESILPLALLFGGHVFLWHTNFGLFAVWRGLLVDHQATAQANSSSAQSGLVVDM